MSDRARFVPKFRIISVKDTDISLQKLYEREEQRLVTLIGNDPVAFLHGFSDPQDIELAGFLASQFAYGRVSQVTCFLKELFGRMTEGPYRFIKSGEFASLADLYYRFQKGTDIVRICEVLKTIIDRHGSVGHMIEHYYDGELRRALWAARKDIIGGGDDFLFFFPKPAPASPLKRWNLYARWMVRKDEIDFGLWNFIGAEHLIVPLDANVYKIGKCHGWTAQRAQTWKAACDITEVLTRLSPEDPLKYDFLLCHVVGIGSHCTGARDQRCLEGCFTDEV